MSFKSRFRAASIFLLVTNQFILAQAANALVPKQDESSLESLTFVSENLQISAQSEAFDDVRVTAADGIANTWDSFRMSHGDWSAIIDKRTGKIDSAEGQGIPFVPGHGNQLQMKDISADLGDDRPIDLAGMEAITRAFLPRVTSLLGVDPSTLILNQGRSGQPADYLWYIDFDVTYGGMAVEGARVVFRVNSGNLIQFGSENLPSEGAQVPKAKVNRNQALKTLASYIGGFGAADSFLDGGSEHLIPVALADGGTDGFEQGRGRGLARVWQFAFRRAGDLGTWRARIDAASGRMIEFRDMNDYATAQVTGGVNTSLNSTKVLPMPFADVASGVYANSAGVYNYSGANSSALNGQYVKIIDACGAIAMTPDASGNFAFGTSSGTSDCDTPGSGGAGNTRASRSQFYYLNRAKEIARGWLNLPWLTSQVTANVNLTDTDGDGICNAFWDGVALSLYKKTGSCSNSGEIQAVGLHEFGHGLDANDGSGPSPDKGTGETYGDWMAALTTHDSCIGPGYLGTNCDGFGDACTSCTGVRDIDYARHTSATPHTVANFTQVRCPAGGGYNGPCSQEGHCESQVSSEALWDLAVRDLPNPGSESAWAIMDRLWYLSRPTATAAFTCYRATSPWSSDGCGSGSLWKTMRAVDDDDGNLSNGTPHSAALYAAFSRHGIACAGDTSTSYRACTQPTAPNLSISAASNQVTLSWSGSTGVYDIYRNEQGCSAGGFIKVDNDVSASPFVDSNVANEVVYYYKVVAHPSGNEACASDTSSCKEAIPCVPPAAPGSLTAIVSGIGQINLSWTSSPGATRYHLYRAATPGGPYVRIAALSGNAFPDTGLSCGQTYYYVVRAAKNETCESGNSTEVVATGCWEQQAYVKASNTGGLDLFGESVAISGDTMVVGAQNEDSNATGVNGDQANNSASTAGAAYVFVRNGSTWSQQAYLKASNTGVLDLFGRAVAISGDTIVVGAHGEDSSATGVNGNQADNSAPYAGAVYVFVRTGSAWSQQAYLKASNTEADDRFGEHLAISGDTIVVGAYGESSNATGVNGDQTNNSASSAGAAYVFVRNGSTWSQQAYLKASNTQTWDWFGREVAISGDTIVVGANYEDSNATGVNGDQANNAAVDSGAAYVFVRSGSTWSQQAYLKASSPGWYDGFGYNVAISGGTVVVGAHGEDSNATGVNGDQANNAAENSGAAYVFVRNESTWSQQAYLKASNSNSYDYFSSVAVSGDTIVVGASYEDSNATRINGDQTSNSAELAGAAYVFVRSGSTWSQQAYLKASNTDASDRFGSVAISRDTIVVGAEGESSNATGVNGDQTNNSASSAGAAYVFFRPHIGEDFYTVPPCRILDTRSTGIPLTSGVPLTISVSGICGVPSTAKAVSLNLTALQAPNSGGITLYPGDISAPGTSTISFSPLTNQANNTVMPLATNGSGTLKALATITGGGNVNIALDVNGYYQ